jgi:hypothetical protein
MTCTKTLAVLLAAALIGTAASAADRDHLPAKYHGLWCGDAANDEKSMSRARGRDCHGSSGANAMIVTAEGYKAYASQCKVLVTMTYRKDDQLTTFYCWPSSSHPADFERAWVKTFWFSIIDGKLLITESETRP